MTKNKILDVMLGTQTKRQAWDWENMESTSNGERREIISMYLRTLSKWTILYNSLGRGFNKHEKIFVTWSKDKIICSNSSCIMLSAQVHHLREAHQMGITEGEGRWGSALRSSAAVLGITPSLSETCSPRNRSLEVEGWVYFDKFLRCFWCASKCKNP